MINIVLCLVPLVRPSMLILEYLGQNALMSIVLSSPLDVHASPMHSVELVLDVTRSSW